MSELIEQLQAALTQPPGANPSLLAPVLTAYFQGELGREVEAGGRTWRLGGADLDALLRHLAGGSWAPELVRMKQAGSAHDSLLALGFRDTPFSDVAAFTELNDIPLARILDARAGVDAPEVLLDFARTASSARRKSAALAAAIVALKEVPPGLEAELELREATFAPLMRKALRALGPERASEVALRQLRSSDGKPEFRWQALAPVEDCYGPFFTPAAEQTIAERIEELADQSLGYWEGTGDRLARTEEWDTVLALAQRRAPAQPGWRRALRKMLGLRVSAGWALPPELDELIDPGGAAKLNYDVWKVVVALLKAIPPERAERLLASASYERPKDALRFLIPGLSDAMLARLAELHVSLRDDPEHKDTLVATDLRPLGPAFGPALQAALAEVKPKAGYLKALQRNLDKPVFEALSKWLEERPAPDAKPKAKKTAARKKA